MRKKAFISSCEASASENGVSASEMREKRILSIVCSISVIVSLDISNANDHFIRRDRATCM